MVWWSPHSSVLPVMLVDCMSHSMIAHISNTQLLLFVFSVSKRQVDTGLLQFWVGWCYQYSLTNFVYFLLKLHPILSASDLKLIDRVGSFMYLFFSNMEICCIYSSYMIVNWISLGFGWWSPCKETIWRRHFGPLDILMDIYHYF